MVKRDTRMLASLPEVRVAHVCTLTGGYHELPSSIEELRPAPKPSPAEQQSKLRRITHLIYKHLLKVVYGDIYRVGQNCVYIRRI
jgi:hypothetical protein